MKSRVCSMVHQRPPLVADGGYLSGSGYTVPIDGTEGWQTGAIFQKTDGGSGTALYVNEGSMTSSDFNAIDAGGITTPPIIITGDTADALVGGGIQYGTPTDEITYTPVTGGSHSGFQIYLTSEDCIGGLSIAAYRTKVTLTGTTNATAYGGNFWVKLDCDDYTGHYLGGHPVGCIGIIECVGTARTAPSSYATLAGVCGEVRPISGIVNAGGVICGVHAKVFGTSAQVTTGDVVGLFVESVGGAVADYAILVRPHVSAGWTTAISIDSSYSTITNGIVFTGTIPTRIFQYADVTEIDEPGAGHLLQYGVSGAPIVWTPTATCTGLQMYITSTGPEAGGFGLAGVRVKVTLTGTTRITANAGQFWTKIDCDDYTGHYLGGHPTGLSGVIECAGTSRTATSPYAVMAGVCGEVRPITTTTPDMGGVICGLHAKIFGVASEVTTGSVVGLFVQAIAGSAADIGILIQPHTGGAAWTVGIDIDSVYGPIATGIDIGNVTIGINITGTSTTGISISGAAEYGIDIAWASVSTTGTAADPVYGDRTADGGTQGCISVGTGATPVTVAGTGTHVSYQTNITLNGTLAQYDLFGGFLAICTVAAAQSVTDGIVSAVTGYIRNDGSAGAFVVKSVQEAVRGVIYTASGDESVRQAAVVANIKDFGAHANAEEIAGLAMEFKIAARHGAGRASAIFIQSVNCAVDMDAVIELDAGNESKFTNFIKGNTTGSTCFTANTSALGADTCVHVITVEIDGTTGYIPVLASVPSG